MSSHATEGARQEAAPAGGDGSLANSAPVEDEPVSDAVTGDVAAGQVPAGDAASPGAASSGAESSGAESPGDETAGEESEGDQGDDDDSQRPNDAASDLAADDADYSDDDDQSPGYDDPDDGDLDDDDPGYGDPGYGDPDDGAYDDEIPYKRPKVSKLAVVALITGILPLVPVALITGIAALIGIRRSGRRGHGMAVSALFIATAWIIVVGAVATVATLTHGFKKPVTITYKEASVFKLQEGDCINTPNGQQVTIVPCTTPHDDEVFGTLTLTGAKWPGTAAVEQQASAGCASMLAGYLNPQLAISLAQTYVYPNQTDWTAGTRAVICEVHAASGQLSQSVRGAA
jgi:Septum formation